MLGLGFIRLLRVFGFRSLADVEGVSAMQVTPAWQATWEDYLGGRSVRLTLGYLFPFTRYGIGPLGCRPTPKALASNPKP